VQRCDQYLCGGVSHLYTPPHEWGRPVETPLPLGGGVCVRVCVCVCVCVCMQVSRHNICMYVYVYICMYVYAYAYICMCDSPISLGSYPQAHTHTLRHMSISMRRLDTEHYIYMMYSRGTCQWICTAKLLHNIHYECIIYMYIMAMLQVQSAHE